MNHAFIAYENALRRLKEQVDREYPSYANDLLALQTRLLENIAGELKSTSGDIKIQQAERRRILAELNILTKQIKRRSFIELCVEMDLLFTYLANLQKTVQDAHTIFSGEKRVWSDQCKYIARNLPTMPMLGKRITTHILNADQTKLSYINDCVVRLGELIEDFSSICEEGTKQARKQREDIQFKLTLLQRNLQQIDTVFDGLISAYQSELRLRSQESEENGTQSYFQVSEQSNNIDEQNSKRRQGQKVPRAKKRQEERRTKYRETVKDTMQSTFIEREQQVNIHPGTTKQGDGENELDRNLYRELVETLLEIPGIGEQGFRTALLTTLPVNDLPRSLSSFTDISNIVRDLRKLFLSSGENALQIFIESAKLRVVGLDIYNRLEKLQRQIVTNRENKT